jgi:hypothetical protein
MGQVLIIQKKMGQNRAGNLGHELNRDPVCERTIPALGNAPMDLRENMEPEGTLRDARLLKDLPIDARQISRKVNIAIGEGTPEPFCVVITRIDLARRDEPLDIALTVRGTKKKEKTGQRFIANKKGFLFEQEGNRSMNDQSVRGWRGQNLNIQHETQVAHHRGQGHAGRKTTKRRRGRRKGRRDLDRSDQRRNLERGDDRKTTG